MSDTKAVMLTIDAVDSLFDPLTQQAVIRITYSVSVAPLNEASTTISVTTIISPTDSSATIRQNMIDAIKSQTLLDLSKVLDTEDILFPTYTTGLGVLNAETRTDSFIAAGNGQTVDVSLNPLTTFSLNVKAVPDTGIPVSWQVVLEGSLDGINWTTILTHTQLIPLGQTVSSGANHDPSLYFRSRCVAVLLGTASAIEATILGVP